MKAKATRVVGLSRVDGADTMELLAAPVLSAKILAEIAVAKGDVSRAKKHHHRLGGRIHLSEGEFTKELPTRTEKDRQFVLAFTLARRVPLVKPNAVWALAFPKSAV